MTGKRSWPHAFGLVAAHPSLWPTALRQAGRLARPGWWRRPPFLPVPDREYVRFRLETQYGTGPDGSGAGVVGGVVPDDVLTYLRWCRDQERLTRPSR